MPDNDPNLVIPVTFNFDDLKITINPVTGMIRGDNEPLLLCVREDAHSLKHVSASRRSLHPGPFSSSMGDQRPDLQTTTGFLLRVSRNDI